MLPRNYETIYIANPSISDTRVAEINTRIKQVIEGAQGKLLNTDLWGKRKMAYPIQKENKGYYVYLTYSANNECVAEIERNLRINEDIFRFLTVKMEEGVDPMAAVAEYKKRLEAHARRERERAERDAERGADGGRGGPRGGRGRRNFEEEAPVAQAEEAVSELDESEEE